MKVEVVVVLEGDVGLIEDVASLNFKEPCARDGTGLAFMAFEAVFVGGAGMTHSATG